MMLKVSRKSRLVARAMAIGEQRRIVSVTNWIKLRSHRMRCRVMSSCTQRTASGVNEP